MDDLEPLPKDIAGLSEKELQDWWRDLLLTERTWSEICMERHDKNDDDVQSALKQWWFSVHRALLFYTRTQAGGGLPIEPFPAQLMLRLSRISHDLGHGDVSELITDLQKGGGRNSKGWTEREDIANAIFYIKACQEGVIKNRAFNQTVSDAFNVTKRTVQRWCENADDYCAAFSSARSAKVIEERMRRSAERYSRYGRGAPSPGN